MVFGISSSTWRWEGTKLGSRPSAAGGEHGRGIEGGGVGGHHRGHDVLLAGCTRGGGNAVDEHVVDHGMLGQHPLDEAGVHEVAVVADAAALAVVEEQPAFLVGVAHVARPQPPASGLGGRSLGVAVVLDHGLAAGGARADLAHDRRGALVVVVVEDLHLQAGDGTPERSRSGPCPTGLKASPPSTAPYHSNTDTPKRCSNCSQMPAGMPADDHEADRVVGVVGPGRFAVHGGGHAAQQREGGAAVVAGHVPQARLGEPAAEHSPEARHHRRAEGDGQGVPVGEREPGVGALVGLVAHQAAQHARSCRTGCSPTRPPWGRRWCPRCT